MKDCTLAKGGLIMRYKMPSGKAINIPDATIKNFMNVLELTKEEAIQTYLEDEGLLENEEQIALDKKAKKLSHAVHDIKDTAKKPRKKPKRIVSDEKKTLFAEILSELEYNYTENVSVLIPNKLIQVKIGEKTFKIDLIEQRPPKK